MHLKGARFFPPGILIIYDMHELHKIRKGFGGFTFLIKKALISFGNGYLKFEVKLTSTNMGLSKSWNSNNSRISSKLLIENLYSRINLKSMYFGLDSSFVRESKSFKSNV